MLGICVGMQILFERGVEHGDDAEGCGVWPGAVSRWRRRSCRTWAGTPCRRPGAACSSTAWATSASTSCTPTASAFPLAAEGPPSPLPRPLVTWAEHGDRFVAGVENGALSATQFHPEKSGDAGAQLLTNWLQTLD